MSCGEWRLIMSNQNNQNNQNQNNQQGTYANGSQLYKDSLKAIQQNEHIKFWNSDSKEYTNSDSLLNIDIVKSIWLENKE